MTSRVWFISSVVLLEVQALYENNTRKSTKVKPRKEKSVFSVSTNCMTLRQIPNLSQLHFFNIEDKGFSTKQ